MIDIITLTGGLVRDAEKKAIPNGQQVTQFTIAQSDNKQNRDTQEWETIRSLYLDVTIWDENPDWKKNPVAWAEMAASLAKGDKVAVRGKLHTRQWQDRDGNNRSKVEFLAESFFTTPTQSATPVGGWQRQTPPPQQHQGNQWGNPAPTGQAQDDDAPF